MPFRKIVLFICIYFISIQTLQSYNIDTDHAILYKGQNNGSMFGFAVEFISTAEGYKLYIGAPKENSTGAVHICDVREDRCQPHYRRISNDKSTFRTSLYSGEMFGSTITDLNNTAEVCAFRWIDTNYERQNYRFMPGRCQRTHNGSSVADDMPLADGAKYIDDKRQEFKYGVAQAGFSADGNKDGFFVLGAPGMAEWRGGFVVYDQTSLEFDQQYDLPIFSYLGYSVVVGKFCPGKGKVCFAAGAPILRREGMVFVYEYNTEVLSMSVIYTIRPNRVTGRQLFSYFGGSLCAADVNGDGVDDILIGAPFYNDLDGAAPSVDEGRVYVYNNIATLESPINGDGNYFSENPTILSGSKTSHARFGTSIANAGDLNMDEFEDVAVGAPYEDDGRGVVYIYHGSADGIVPKFSQRIRGRSLSDSVSTFGWYISKSVDIDGNSYPDIAVGNYLSDTAVVLRTRPIADIRGNITMDPSLIIQNNTCSDSREGCFNISICFSFTGRNLPKKLVVRYNMTLDAEKSADRRRVMANMPTGIADTASNIITVTARTGSCHSYQAFTLTELRNTDMFSRVHVIADYDLVQPANTTSDIQPIMNSTRSRRIENDIAFQINCGDDGQCNADLNLQLSVKTSNPEDYVIVNKTKTVYLKFKLTNRGEDAFANVIRVTWSGTVEYQTVGSSPQHPVMCVTVLDPDSLYKYRCEVGRVVRNDPMWFTISLDAHDIPTTEPSLSVQAVVSTSSNESNPADNRVDAEVDVKIVAIINITSAIQDDIRLVESQMENRQLKLLHRYVITNMGPSFLPSTSIVVSVPAFKSTEKLVMTVQVKIQFDDGREEFCSAVTPEGKIGEDVTSTTINPNPATSIDELPTLKPKRRKRSVEKIIDNGGNIGDVTCPEYPCRQYQCQISRMSPGENIALNATIEFPAKNLPKGLDLVRYYTRLEVQQPKHPLFQMWHHPADRTVATNIFIQRTGGSVNIWIIVGSVVGGLLLFLILFLVLWKLGFFKRTKKHELEKWKRESGYYKKSRSSARGSDRASPPDATTPLTETEDDKMKLP